MHLFCCDLWDPGSFVSLNLCKTAIPVELYRWVWIDLFCVYTGKFTFTCFSFPSLSNCLDKRSLLAISLCCSSSLCSSLVYFSSFSFTWSKSHFFTKASALWNTTNVLDYAPTDNSYAMLVCTSCFLFSNSSSRWFPNVIFLAFPLALHFSTHCVSVSVLREWSSVWGDCWLSVFWL